MRTVNIGEAKTHLSKLVDQAARGESFVIAKAGKPVVRVVPLAPLGPAQIRRVGFLAGQIVVPADFDRMGDAEIEGDLTAPPKALPNAHNRKHR
jgi:prevent-host-death family protein